MSATYDPDDIRFLIRLYHELSRAPDAIEQIEILSEINPEFTYDDFNLFNASIKDAIDPFRHTIRTLRSFYEDDIEDKLFEKADCIKQHQTKIIEEFLELCHKLIHIINSKLLPNASENILKSFCYKIKGDIYRYIIESGEDSEIEKAKHESENAYEASIQAFTSDDPNFLPIKLQSILNYAVFLYEHIKNKQKAIELLETSLNNALEKVEFISEDQAMLNQALNAISVMKTNLLAWKSE